MEALGWSLIAGGLVLLVSGLVFLVRMRREPSAQQQDAEQTVREIDDQPHETRRERGDKS
jgi:hypothetical protein